MARVRFFRSAGGRKLAFTVEGTGPMLALPAWWVSHLEHDDATPSYRAFFERLAMRFTVVRYDRAGVGLSDRSRRTYTLDSELNDFTRLVDEIGADRVNLLGFSCGAPVALAFAAEHPDRVDRLVLYGGFVRGCELASAEVRDALVALVRAGGTLGSRTLADMFHPTADAAGRLAFLAGMRASAEPEMAARLLELTYALDASAYVARVRAPSLVIHRKRDYAIAHAHAVALAAELPGATLVTTPGVEHIPWYGDAAPVLRAVIAFLSDRELTAGGETRPTLRRDGESWILDAFGRRVSLRDSKGIADLAQLLARPGHAIHVRELDGSPLPTGSVDRTLDPRALRALRRRLADIERTLARGETDRASEAMRAERDALREQLGRDVGMSGARRLGDPVERTRKAVTARLRETIRRIGRVHRAAGQHLATSVRTGVHCEYAPAPLVHWEVALDPI